MKEMNRKEFFKKQGIKMITPQDVIDGKLMTSPKKHTTEEWEKDFEILWRMCFETGAGIRHKDQYKSIKSFIFQALSTERANWIRKSYKRGFDHGWDNGVEFEQARYKKTLEKALNDALKFCEDELKKDESNLHTAGRIAMIKDLKEHLVQGLYE